MNKMLVKEKGVGEEKECWVISESYLSQTWCELIRASALFSLGTLVTENDEQEWNDNIMLSNLILKLLHYAKDFNWIFDYTLSKLFNSMLIINQEIMK